METNISIFFIILKDIVLLYDYIKFKLHIFHSLGKLRKNSISQEEVINSYVIFGIIGEFEKSVDDIFRLD